MLVKLKTHVTPEMFIEATFSKEYRHEYIIVDDHTIRISTTIIDLEELQKPHKQKFLYLLEDLIKFYDVVEEEVPDEGF